MDFLSNMLPQLIVSNFTFYSMFLSILKSKFIRIVLTFTFGIYFFFIKNAKTSIFFSFQNRDRNVNEQILTVEREKRMNMKIFGRKNLIEFDFNVFLK